MGIIDTAKSAFKLAQQLDNIELQRTILEMQSQALELQEENRALRERVTQLNDALQFSEDLTFNGRFYMKADAPDEFFCPGCWDGKRLASRITRHVSGRPHCAVCGTVYAHR